MGVFSVQLSVADSLYTPAVTRNRLQIKAVTMALQHIDVTMSLLVVYRSLGAQVPVC